MFGRSKSAEVEVKEAADLQAKGAVLLDVRENDEWFAGHAPCAVHLPLSRVSGAASTFGGKQVLTVCRSGGRSARAAKWLADAGIDVRNVSGGMSSWQDAGLPVSRDDGSPGTIA